MGKFGVEVLEKGWGTLFELGIGFNIEPITLEQEGIELRVERAKRKGKSVDGVIGELKDLEEFKLGKSCWDGSDQVKLKIKVKKGSQSPN